MVAFGKLDFVVQSKSRPDLTKNMLFPPLELRIYGLEFKHTVGLVITIIRKWIYNPRLLLYLLYIPFTLVTLKVYTPAFVEDAEQYLV